MSRDKPFKYYNTRGLAEDFMDRVQANWQQEVQGVLIDRLVVKLKSSKNCLRLLNKDRYSSIENETKTLIRLTKIQLGIQSDPLSVDLHVKEEKAMQEYNMLNKARITFLKQKVKGECLKW